MCETMLTHVWQEAGMGVAPYTYVGCEDTGYLSTNCDACGAGLRYVFFVRDAKGCQYQVGCDCVLKTNDAKLVKVVSEAQKKINEAKAEAKREKEEEKRMAEHAAKLQAQREKNGGLTDHELNAQKSRQKVVEAKEFNSWLLGKLNLTGQEYYWDGLNDLYRQKIVDKSDRYIDIVKGIFCKKAGRTGSKAYKQAEVEFENWLESVR